MPEPLASHAEPSGLTARRVAADLLERVLHKSRPLDEALGGPAAHPDLAALTDRDRAFVRMLVGTVLRRLGTLRRLLAIYVTTALPPDVPRAETALLLGAAQILWLNVPDHAAVDLSVRLVQADRRAARYAGLINAVLRRVAREGVSRLPDIEAESPDIPDWLLTRWRRNYGAEATQAIGAALAAPPALDLTVKADAQSWAAQLDGELLSTGTVRTLAPGAVPQLPGYAEGAWWVQDAAAALPARLLGDVTGRSVADLCAAPGGKAAQLALAGATVTAVDRALPRMATLDANLTRLKLNATRVVADATAWTGGPFDAVLLDAPCTSTGTIRRHPDIAWIKSERDLAPLSALQTRLLDQAVTLIRPGGLLVYCTCSLEPEEGEQQVAGLLERNPRLRRMPVRADEVGGLNEIITAVGDVRTLPCHLLHADPRMAGLDGFYMARLQRA
jgi:16S rRNA (cytosine967-C5)-methyltransferase